MKTSNESNLSTSLSMYDRAQSVLAGSVGHDLRYALPGPIYTARGKGGRKWDVDSNEYIDFLVGNAALLLGHADQEVVAAVQSVVADGTHFGNDHPLQLEWSELIQQMCQRLNVYVLQIPARNPHYLLFGLPELLRGDRGC